MTAAEVAVVHDKYAAAVDMVRRYLEQYGRRERTTGRLTFDFDLKDGGVVEKTVTVRRKEH